jgi:hypothetical protein
MFLVLYDLKFPLLGARFQNIPADIAPRFNHQKAGMSKGSQKRRAIIKTL